MKKDRKSFKIGDGSLTLYEGEISNNNHSFEKLKEEISKWYYNAKQTAYIQIGSEKENDCGLYRFGEFDPFQFGSKVPLFADKFQSAKIIIEIIIAKSGKLQMIMWIIPKIEPNQLNIKELLKNHKLK